MQSDVRQQFDEQAMAVYENGKRLLGYNATRFLQKLRRDGGVAAAKSWLRQKNRDKPTNGFLKLVDAGRLDLSLEALVLKHPWNTLFTDAELDVARQRLARFNYVGSQKSRNVDSRRDKSMRRSSSHGSTSSGSDQGGASETRAWITSRSFPLSTNAKHMKDQLWFNIWQRRRWPYVEVEDGDTLYWYDGTEKAIIWKSQVRQAIRFEFATKDEVKRRLQAAFGLTVGNDPYFEAAKAHGYCIAFKVDALERLTLAKPTDCKFPHLGWLRCTDDEAQRWLTGAPASQVFDEVFQAAAELEKEGHFSPSSDEQECRTKWRAIAERRGQPDFRKKLISAYGGRFAITECDAEQALEAAHIIPYSDSGVHAVTNGLLLRSDIHTLFDLHLLAIDPATLRIALAPSIKATTFSELSGRTLRCPKNVAYHPNPQGLSHRWRKFGA